MLIVGLLAGERKRRKATLEVPIITQEGNNALMQWQWDIMEQVIVETWVVELTGHGD